MFPWILRYFGSFGNLYNAETILGNAKIAAHGVVVTKGLTLGLDNINNLKDAYAALGKKHATKILVDPDNFRVGLVIPVLFENIITHSLNWYIFCLRMTS